MTRRLREKKSQQGLASAGLPHPMNAWKRKLGADPTRYFWPAGGTRGKVRGSPKSLGFILKGNMHDILSQSRQFFDTSQCGPKWLAVGGTDADINRAEPLAWLKTPINIESGTLHDSFVFRFVGSPARFQAWCFWFSNPEVKGFDSYATFLLNTISFLMAIFLSLAVRTSCGVREGMSQHMLW